jgi:hypothetical protein
MFSATPDIIDVDDTVEAPTERLIAHVDRAKAALLGVSQQAVATDLNTALRGEDVSYLHSSTAKYPIPLRLELPVADKAGMATVLDLKTRARADNWYRCRRSSTSNGPSAKTPSTTRICCRWCSCSATWPAYSTVRCTACSKSSPICAAKRSAANRWNSSSFASRTIPTAIA